MRSNFPEVTERLVKDQIRTKLNNSSRQFYKTQSISCTASPYAAAAAAAVAASVSVNGGGVHCNPGGLPSVASLPGASNAVSAVSNTTSSAGPGGNPVAGLTSANGGGGAFVTGAAPIPMQAFGQNSCVFPTSTAYVSPTGGAGGGPVQAMAGGGGGGGGGSSTGSVGGAPDTPPGSNGSGNGSGNSLPVSVPSLSALQSSGGGGRANSVGIAAAVGLPGEHGMNMSF